MTELSFLLSLLLDHKITKATKEAITERIKYVEAQINTMRLVPTPPQGRVARDVTAQAPSTQALLDKEASAPPGLTNLPLIPTLAPALPNASSRIRGGEVSTGGSQGTTIKGPRKF